MKKFYLVLGILGLVASAAMYLIGSNDSALTELYDLFWIPLPIAGIGFLGAMSKKK